MANQSGNTCPDPERAQEDEPLDLRRWLRELRASVVYYPLLASVAAIGLAAITLTIDAITPDELLPTSIPSDNAAILLGTVSGAMITAVVVVFWIRGMLVMLSSGQFSSRVLRGYLRDHFQQVVMGFMVGVFVYSTVVLLALDASSSGGASSASSAAPLISVSVAAFLAVSVLLAIVGAIGNSARMTQVDEVVRKVTDTTLAAICKQHPATVEAPVGPPATGDDCTTVLAEDTGWVQSIDVGRLLAALPEDTTVRVQVRVGMFVTEGRPLCTIHSLEHQASPDAVRGSILLGRTRTNEEDIEYGIRQLVDIALPGLAPAATDGTTAYEVIAHVGAVLRTLLSRELPPRVLTGDGGRTVIRDQQLTIADYVTRTIDPLRSPAAAHPPTAASLIEMLGSVAGDLHDAGRHDRAALVADQARLVFDGCAATNPHPEDLRRVREVATRHGLLVDRPRAAAGTDDGDRPSTPVTSVTGG